MALNSDFDPPDFGAARAATAGVIVTFFPDADFDHRLQAIAREANPLVVVDNSADPAVHERLLALCLAHNVRFIANPENRGLATALNTAFTELAETGSTWAIAFDQDSTPEPCFAQALRTAAESRPACAVVGADWVDVSRPSVRSKHLRPYPGFPIGFQRIEALRDLDHMTCVITSGSLFKLSTWRTLGGFDPALFLDLVDTDYCLRARAAGHTIVVAANARLSHRRGAKQPIWRFGRTWWPAFMPPLRLQYLFRNRLRLLGRHALRAPHWVLFETVYALKIVLEILFLEDRKCAKLWACLRGKKDALLGRKGRIRENL